MNMNMNIDMNTNMISSINLNSTVTNSNSNVNKSYRGVYKTASGKYKSQIQLHGKQYYLGVFDLEEEAALMYNKFVLENGREDIMNQNIISNDKQSMNGMDIPITIHDNNTSTMNSLEPINENDIKRNIQEMIQLGKLCYMLQEKYDQLHQLISIFESSIDINSFDKMIQLHQNLISHLIELKFVTTNKYLKNPSYWIELKNKISV